VHASGRWHMCRHVGVDVWPCVPLLYVVTYATRTWLAIGGQTTGGHASATAVRWTELLAQTAHAGRVLLSELVALPTPAPLSRLPLDAASCCRFRLCHCVASRQATTSEQAISAALKSS